MNAKSLSAVLGVSEATVSRMRRRDFLLERGTKPFELGVLFVRLFRSLDAIVGGDEAVAKAWIKNPNLALETPAAGEDFDHSRTDRCHCLPGQPARSRLKKSGSKARCGVWSRRSTASRR